MSSPKVRFLRGKIKDLSSLPSTNLRRSSWRIAKDLPTSFSYALKGIGYALKSQRNFRIQIILGVLTYIVGIFLEINATNLSIITCMVALVLILELINTAIEATVDLAIGRKFHPLARIAKDCAAAAVLIASFGAVLVAFIILLQPLRIRLGL
ncbi:diacylglycerol kinase family protein [Prochlorococcus sp. MIT 1223]|uniref:diacylglycerol kinase family protein n=1 Tax=Prochlorococcus sp. MIT 1223 TaxID=3096217 RepID=UPI002A75DD03|nr:diacylglycerol kinase family protein [Prochlorococcus sp. MIT 1223]